MIARYSRKEMSQVWNERRRYQLWLKVEMAVCEELAKMGKIPKKDSLVLQKAVKALEKAGGVDPARVDEIENTTRHDVIAFTTAVAEKIGPISRYIHYGLTSSDVVDTALSLSIQSAGEILKQDIEKLLGVLKAKAIRYRDLPTMGRSHGISAEPTSFGLKFLGWYCEWQRNLQRITQALEQLRVGKLSGAVGVNAHWNPEFEKNVLARLGLKREGVSTQILPRDRHAEFFSVLALCGASLERIAVELRHLQRTEVGEVLENFNPGQKGSSAMPHKRNPISSENITGCARMLRGYAMPALENVALWHERDISHSSVERIAFPDATLLLDYAITRMIGVIEKLWVREERVQENLKKAGGTVFSGHYLLALVEEGAPREQAYAWVQECAMKSFETGADFLELLGLHGEIGKYLTQKRIQELGSMKYQLRNVREIYESVLPKKSRR